MGFFIAYRTRVENQFKVTGVLNFRRWWRWPAKYCIAPSKMYFCSAILNLILSLKQKKMKFKPRIKLNHKRGYYVEVDFLCFLFFYFFYFFALCKWVRITRCTKIQFLLALTQCWQMHCNNGTSKRKESNLWSRCLGKMHWK